MAIKDPMEDLEARAAEVADVLRLIANEKRLLILCHLAQAGELSVGALNSRIDLAQSALSQHLARLRADGLVTTRRQAQMMHYRIADTRIGALLSALYTIFCNDTERDARS